MRTISVVSILLLGVCAGCANTDDSTSAVGQNTGSATGQSQQASLKPLAPSEPGWPPPGTVFTHPHGGGAQVEMWGPPPVGQP